MKTKEDLKLLEDFPIPAWEEWKQTVKDFLKGADYDKVMHTKTYEGITLEPIYRGEDIQDLAFTNALPGEAPYTRGNDAAAFVERAWRVAQAQKTSEPKTLNKELLDELERGLNMLNIYLAHPDEAGGLKLESAEDLALALKGIDLKAAPLMMQPDLDDPDILVWLKDIRSELPTLCGAIAYDPIGELLRKGGLSLKLEAALEKFAEKVKAGLEIVPKMKSIAIDATLYEKAGASATQELGFALATVIFYTRQLLAKGLTIAQIAPRFVVKLALGSNFFMEIAKIRAFRMLFSQAMQAFGADTEAQKVWIHGKTASFNKSTYDLYVNMLRTSTESFAGVIGGVDSLEVDSFDSSLNPIPDAFSKRIARNQQLILAEEAHFGKVADPAGGCYYIESLSSELASKAWQKMQEIEGKGGILKSIEAGDIHRDLADMAKAKIDAVHKRRDHYVGVNMYANPDDEIPQAQDFNIQPLEYVYTLEAGALPRLRALESFEAFRSRVQKADKTVYLINIGTVAEYKARADFSAGFFQTAGFKILQSPALQSVDEAIAAAKDYQAVCICSTDDKYAEIVPELAPKLEGKIRILAGYPLNKVEDYQAAGIDLFIHIRANAFDTLNDLADKMGVKK